MYIRHGLGGVSSQATGSAKVSTETYRGPAHTVDTIRRTVNVDRKLPQARGVAEDAIKGLYAKDYLSEAAAIYYAVCRGVRYTRDPASVELVKDLEMVSRTRQSDCDEMTSTLATLLGQVGIPNVQYVTVGFRPGTVSHVFPRFKDPRGSGRWVVLDPVAGPTAATMLRRVKTVQAYEGV